MNLLLRILAFLVGAFMLFVYLRSLEQEHSIGVHAFFCAFVGFMFWSVWYLHKTKHIKPEDRKRWLSDTATIGAAEAQVYINNWYVHLLFGARNFSSLLLFLIAFFLCPWDLLYQTPMGEAFIEKIRPPSTGYFLQLKFASYAIPFVSVFNALMAISLLLPIIYSDPMPAFAKGRVKSPYMKLSACILGAAALTAMLQYLVFFNFMQDGSWSRGITDAVKNHKWAFALFVYACWYGSHVFTLSLCCFTKSLFTVRKPPHTLGGSEDGY